MKRIVIVANGHLPDTVLSQITTTDFVIGVDRAAYMLLKYGIKPDISLGDFDSVLLEELSEIKKQSKLTKEYSPRKDATDLELAIEEAIRLHPKEVLIIGAIGTRLDHSFVAVQMLEKFIGTDIWVVFRDEKNECVLCNSKCTLDKNDIYKYFSILPITEKISVSISGCVYPIQHTVIQRGLSLGISNEIVSKKAVITVHKGLALVIQSND